MKRPFQFRLRTLLVAAVVMLLAIVADNWLFRHGFIKSQEPGIVQIVAPGLFCIWFVWSGGWKRV